MGPNAEKPSSLTLRQKPFQAMAAVPTLAAARIQEGSAPRARTCPWPAAAGRQRETSASGTLGGTPSEEREMGLRPLRSHEEGKCSRLRLCAGKDGWLFAGEKDAGAAGESSKERIRSRGREEQRGGARGAGKLPPANRDWTWPQIRSDSRSCSDSRGHSCSRATGTLSPSPQQRSVRRDSLMASCQ